MEKNIKQNSGGSCQERVELLSSGRRSWLHPKEFWSGRRTFTEYVDGMEKMKRELEEIGWLNYRD